MNRHIQKFFEQDSEEILSHRCEGIRRERLMRPERVSWNSGERFLEAWNTAVTMGVRFDHVP